MHEYIIGKTGAGKSTLAENELPRSGGFTFIDPHGQSAEKIGDTYSQVIYWEPFDPRCPLAINVFERVPIPQRPIVAEQFISSVKSIYPDNWGPNLEDILRNALYVMLDNDTSPVQLPRTLTDSTYRHRLLQRCTNKEVVAFWQDEFPKRRNPDDELRSTLNKVRIFALDPTLRRVLSHNSINLRRIMNRGQRLVINLSVSQLGEKPSAVLGALIINGIYQAALARSVIPESARIDHRLVVDEWQNFATTTFGNILAEARKYKLHLTLLNQLTGQIRDNALMETVLGNVSRLTVFRVGATDAARLAKELGLPNPEVLIDLDAFEYFRRTGITLQKARTPPPAPAQGYFEGNQARTRTRYRRPI